MIFWIKAVLAPPIYILLSYEDLKKKKKRYWTIAPVLFSTWFLQKNISLVVFYWLTKCHCMVAFTSQDIGQYVYCNYFLTRLWNMKFQINLIFLIKPFLLYDQKVKIKNLNILRTKCLLRWNKKHFSSFVKEFHWSKQNIFFERWKCDFKR